MCNVSSFRAVGVRAPAARSGGPPGFHTTTQEPKRALKRSGSQEHSMRNPEREEKNESCGGRGKIKSKILGGPCGGRSGGGRSGGGGGGRGPEGFEGGFTPLPPSGPFPEQGDPPMPMHALQSGTTPGTGGHRQKSPSHGD